MSSPSSFDPIVCIVGFHHARGPEVETWLGVDEGTDPATENDWSLLPFLALSDGAHSSVEDFSYFTLRRVASADQPATSLFGIACTRQLDASTLINRPADVTRSTVQKAVVVISDSPQHFGPLREKLSIVTKAWFAQRDFVDLTILKDFQASLAKSFKDLEDEKDQFFGLSLREMIHEFKYQTLVLFKCLLLQPKMLFFGSNCERLCMMQFSLISLIPGLIRKLQDCADPQFNDIEEKMVMPTSLKTSERASLLAYVGLPLHIFGKGSLFGPYTPLQQLDLLADHDTKSYVVGSTNSLLLAQKDRYSDILVNLDDETVTISSQPLKNALILTTPDRRWIDFLNQTVNDTWDESNPGRPKNLGYAGSEEFIRLQFEEYLLALLSATKYKLFAESKKDEAKQSILDIEGDPANEFSAEFIKAWMRTENFRIFNKYTDSHIFDIVEPNHPCSGGLSMEDVQRRLAQQVSELHLDERLQSSRDAIGKHLASGQKKVSTAFNSLWNDIEVMREAQRQKTAEQKVAAAAAQSNGTTSSPSSEKAASSVKFPKAPDLSQAQATVQAASQRAGAYFSSWGSWASEKRKGWGRSSSPSASSPPSPTGSSKDNSLPLAPTSQPKSTTTTQDPPANGKVSLQSKSLPEKEPAKAELSNSEKITEIPLDEEKKPEVPLAKKDAETNKSAETESKKEAPVKVAESAEKVSSETVAGASTVDKE